MWTSTAFVQVTRKHTRFLKMKGSIKDDMRRFGLLQLIAKQQKAKVIQMATFIFSLLATFINSLICSVQTSLNTG